MADAAVSAVVELLLSVVKEQIQNEIRLVRGVDKELLDLSDKLKNIRNVLDDADSKQFKDKTVKDWLRRLQQTSYEMEDVLEEWSYALLQHKIQSQSQFVVPPIKQKVCTFIPSSCLSFKKLGVRRDIAKKVQNLKSRLDEILNEKDVHNFVISQPKNDTPHASWRVQSDSSINIEEVQGRKDDRDILVSKLTANGGSHEGLGYKIISIVGAGGLGKTTLAQLVYNDTLVQEFFDFKIWLCVSDPFDVAAIAKGIIESITKKSAPDTYQLDVLLKVLKDSIFGKKFLLVLDDVWNEQEDKWKPLKNVIKYGGVSSKILVTTRKVMVAKIIGTYDEDVHRPDLISDEECWLLMRSAALSGKDEKEHKCFEEIGTEIAKKCNGLPLAAKTLASVLRSKSTIQGWENVLNSEMWELKQAEVELFPHLLLSYHELSPPLKHCFSYCAFFPKDEKIKVDELIRLWMALGYLGSNVGSGGEEMELKGQEYFEDLAMRSLFQDFERDFYTGKIVSCKMHDIVHDFAQFLRNNEKEEISRMKDEKSCRFCDPPLSVSRVKMYRSLFWNKDRFLIYCECLARLRVLKLPMRLMGMGNMIHLQWLDISGAGLSIEDLKSICKLYFLQTLLLQRCFIDEIPNEIGNLVQMRHLNLSHNHELKELPESICSLLRLQTLDIESCLNLRALPEGIHRLQNLKHLLVEGISASCRFPQGVGELSGLRTLSVFHRRSWKKIGLLNKLNHLIGFLSLKLKVCGNSDLEELVEDVVKADLRNKSHLQTLRIEFQDQKSPIDFEDLSSGEEESSSSSSSSLLWVDVIEALQPHHNLKFLRIDGYTGWRLPHWISSPLNNVRSIEIWNSVRVSSLPSMGKLPFLESLVLWSVLELKVVGVEWLGIRGSSSPTHIQSSSSLSTNTTTLVAFPKLKHLTFDRCYELEEWEDLTAEEEESTTIIMPSLLSLNINYCDRLKKLPHRLLRKANSLKLLEIQNSSELFKIYEDEEGSARRSISQNNTQLQFNIY